MTHPRLILDKCLFCEHPISAVTQDALDKAGQAHADYARSVLPYSSDPHFEDFRMDDLVKA